MYTRRTPFLAIHTAQMTTTKHLLLLLVSQVESGTNASDKSHRPSASRKNALLGQSPLYACLVNLISHFVLNITV